MAIPPFSPKRGRPTADQAEAIARTILAAATELFLAEGFEGVSMEALASTAGIPKSTLYKRYADKRALLRAVIDARVLAWSAAASEKNWMLTEDLEQRLKQYSLWIIAWASSPDVRAFSSLAASAWANADEAATRWDSIGFSRMVEHIEHDIRHFGPRTGIMAKDPRGVAVALMAMLSGWLQLNGPNGAGDEAATTDFANIAVDILLRGSAAW